MQLLPQRNKVVVTVLPSPEQSGSIIRPPTETPIRRVQVEAVGPDASVEAGKLYLANILGGQQVGDQLVLSDKAGSSAFLAEWED